MLNTNSGADKTNQKLFYANPDHNLRNYSKHRPHPVSAAETPHNCFLPFNSLILQQFVMFRYGCGQDSHKIISIVFLQSRVSNAHILYWCNIHIGRKNSKIRIIWCTFFLGSCFLWKWWIFVYDFKSHFWAYSYGCIARNSDYNILL